MSTVKMIDAEAANNPDLQWGEYQAVQALCNHVQRGHERKAFTDLAIDRASHMQNLREDILPKKVASEDSSKDKKKRDAARDAGIKYLERYVHLLAFECYACEQLDSRSSMYKGASRGMTFGDWLTSAENQPLHWHSLLDGLKLS